jgi:trk system potassium uptake protein TrkA
MLDYLPFIEGYSSVELAPPQEYVGKTLKELDLIDMFGIQVLAIKEILPKGLTLIPRADFRVEDSDALIVLGPNETLEKMKKI